MRVSIPTWLGPSLLLLTFGYTVGRTVDQITAQAAEHIRVETHSIRPSVATVQIHGILNGKIEGELRGNSRLFIGNTQILTDGANHFAVDAKALLTNVIQVDVPSGMQFVASKNGKKYYPVTSAGGDKIVLQNRIYFATEAEAIAAGYKK